MKNLQNTIKKKITEIEKSIDEISNAIPFDNNFEDGLFDVLRGTILLLEDYIPNLREKVLFRQGTAINDGEIIIEVLELYMDVEGLEKEEISETLLMNASKIFGETNSGFSGSQLLSLLSNYAMQYGVELYYTSIPKNMRKDNMLLTNLKSFNSCQQFKIIKDLCEEIRFKEREEVKNLKISLIKNYGHFSIENLGETELVTDTRHWLQDYKEPLQQYNNALNKFENDIFERNTLDDMRLAFELLLKELLSNSKSLENQIAPIGARMKEAYVSVELRNMVMQIIKYYTEFQNNHVKHDEKINKNEIEYVIELTSIIMKFLIKIIK